MSGAAISPRKIELEALIRVLVEEHAKMKEGLGRVREATAEQDFSSASLELKELESVFRQHIADEEARVLRLLIDKLGVKGASEEIRVFQQHKPIYQLMQKVKDFAALSASELEANQARLAALLDDHTLAEEQRVFPKATRKS